MTARNILLKDAAVIGAGDPIGAENPSSVYAWGSTTSGTGSATIVIEVRGDDTGPWITAGTITLALTTSGVADGFHIAAEWPFIRARVSAISGTGAKVNCNFGV